MHPLFLIVLASCAHAPPVSKLNAPVDGYTMVMSAATCWMGAVWFDAEGTPEPERKARTEEACHGVEREVWGRSTHTRFEQLRALESGSVTDVVTMVGRRAPREDARALQTLAQALADAQREAMWARRAGEQLRNDLEYETERLTADERSGARALQSAVGLRALFDAPVGRFSGDARLLATLTAMDRMEVSRGLPTRMKIFALSDVYSVTFGTLDVFSTLHPETPALPGQWLTLLVDAAKAAGHPVPAGANDPKTRDAAAWAGVLNGFADRLEGETSRSPGLARVVAGAARRLRAEAAGDEHYVSSLAR